MTSQRYATSADVKQVRYRPGNPVRSPRAGGHELLRFERIERAILVHAGWAFDELIDRDGLDDGSPVHAQGHVERDTYPAGRDGRCANEYASRMPSWAEERDAPATPRVAKTVNCDNSATTALTGAKFE